MAKDRTTKEAVIPNAGTETPVITTPVGLTLLGIHNPGITGTSITFKAAKDAAATAQLIKTPANANYAITVTTVTAGYQQVDPTVFEGVEFFSIVSNATEAAARTLTLVFGRVGA